MGPGPWPWPKSHRLIQVAGGGTHSTPMKNLCVCGKTVKVTDRKWASKTVRVKVALWRDSREKVKVPDPRKSYPQPMVRPKWFRAWLRVRSSSTEVCPSCRRPQFCTARVRVRIRNSHEHKMELKADGTVEPIAHRNTRKPKATSCKGCDSRISPGCIGLAHVLTAHSRPAYDAGPPVTLGHCGATSSGATVRRPRRTSAGSGRLHCSSAVAKWLALAGHPV
jgi:hypothetical protein